MDFDRILELIFNKVTGLILALTAAFVAMLSMSGCFMYDCSIWACRTITCDDTKCESCEQTTIIWNDENHRRQSASALGIGGLGAYFMSEKEIECTYARIDCLYAEDGCEYDGSCGYIVCGGTNLSCWETICEGGCLMNCIKLYSGDLACTCLNCTIYCDGYPDEYIPENHNKNCGGCDNGPYRPKDYNENLRHPYYGEGYEVMTGGGCSQPEPEIGNMLGAVSLYYYDYDESEWKNYTSVGIYDATFRLPVAELEGYEFRGYYTQSGGKGVKLTDNEGAVIDKETLISRNGKDIYARYSKVRGEDKFSTVFEITVNGENTRIYSIEEGFDIEKLINEIIPLDYGNRFISVIASYENEKTEICNTQGFIDGYRIYDPEEYGITLHDEIVFIEISECELMHDVTLHGFTSTETEKYLHKTPVSELPFEEIEGYVFLGFSEIENSIADIVAEDTEIDRNMELYAVYRRNITLRLEGNATSAEDFVFYVDERITLPDAADIPIGQYFKGWYPADGKLANGMVPSAPYIGEITVTALMDGVTFIPVWDDVIYTVTYTVNGEVFETATYKYGDTLTLITDVTLEFYDFLYWTDKGGSTQVTEIPATAHEDKEFTAVLAARTFYNQLASEGGTISSFLAELKYGMLAGEYSIEVPLRNGFDFKGWYVSVDGGRVYVTDSLGAAIIDYTAENLGVSTYDELAALKLYAAWEPTKHTVTFLVNGQMHSEVKVEHGSTVTAPSVPTLPGYTVAEWSVYGNLFDFDSPILMDIALEAVLEPMRYNIVLVVIPSEGKLTIPGTSGYVEYGYESMPAIPYVFDSGTLYWFDTAEVYSNNSYMSFIGWAYNGVIIIDQYGNVNDEALAMIPVGDDGVIALTAMFQ